jgi:hypothetical protein
VLSIVGRFDPGTAVHLVRSDSQGGPPMRPHESPELVETTTADATGSVTFAAAAGADGWVLGRKDYAPLTIKATSIGPPGQLPVQPDQPFTPRAPDRTPTTAGSRRNRALGLDPPAGPGTWRTRQ